MSRIKIDEISWYTLVDEYGNPEIVCPEHITPEELSNLKQDQVRTSNEVSDDEFIFCDRCGEAIVVH